MMDEILSENVVLKKTYQGNIELINELYMKIKKINPQEIMVFSRGSSSNASLYFKYLCEIDLGIPVQLINPSVITVYHGKLTFKNRLIIAVSQGGRGEDLNLLMEKAKREKAFTIAITNFPESPLAIKANYHLDLSVDEEKSIAATKTFTAELLMLLMIIDAFKTDKKLNMALLDNVFNKVYGLNDEINNLANKYTLVDDVFVFSRGISMAIAKELECKLQESCFVNAHAFATSDFSHGPIALAEPKRHGIFIASADETENDSLDFIKRIKSFGMKISIITDSEVLFKEVGIGVLLPKTNKWMFPLVAALTCQMFACYLAGEKGINPDESRNLEKFVMTK